MSSYTKAPNTEHQIELVSEHLLDESSLTSKDLNELQSSVEPNSINPSCLRFKEMTAIISMFLSAFFYSLAGVLIHWGSMLGYSWGELLLIRGLSQGTITIMYTILARQSIKSARHTWPWIALRGIFGAASGLGNYYAITVLPLGDAITVYSIYPVLATLFAACVLKESIGFEHVISLLLSTGGVILISRPGFIFGTSGNFNQQYPNGEYGYLASIGAAVVAGWTYVTMRKAKQAATMALLLSHSFFTTIEGIIIPSIIHDWYGVHEWKDWILFLGLGVVGFLAQWTMNYAGQNIDASIASLIRSSDTVFAYILGIIFFGENPYWITIIGALLVLASVGVISIYKIFKNKAAITKSIPKSIDANPK